MTKYCPNCNQPLYYFPDRELICANKDCKRYAPDTYYLEDYCYPVNNVKFKKGILWNRTTQ